jgi:hypothetical protein
MKKELLINEEGEVVMKGKEFPDVDLVGKVFDQGVIGNIGKARREEQRGLNSAQDGLDLIQEYGFSLNPITARARIIGVMMKMEEKALSGDVRAMQMFLDRTIGAVTQKIATGSMKFDKLSDRELLEIATRKLKKQSI